MTDSQFETLRQEHRPFGASSASSFEAMETRLTKLEVLMEAKPDKVSVYQTSMAVSLSYIATVGVALLFLGIIFVS